MRIAALSDFHIGSMEGADPFGHSERAFLAFLDRLEADHDRLVLLGDIYQTDHGLLPGTESARILLHTAQKRYPRLAERMAGPHYHYVGGNHDRFTWNDVNAVESLRLEDNGLAALFIHGHQFDPLLNGPIRHLSHLSTWVAGRLRRFRLLGAVESLERTDVFVKDALFRGRLGPYRRAAQRLAEQHGVRVVVMGHTHVPVRVPLHGGVLVNVGSCSHGKKTHVSIDTATGEIRLHTG